ncbi:MAG: carboxymuconolactone decarboxylase family protein [Pseudomonadales bacterium]
MGSAAGLSTEKIRALDDFEKSDLFDAREKVALQYADAMTLSNEDVSDDLFARLADHFDEHSIIELTAAIAWENASSKFNRALRVESQQLWQPADS